MGRKIKETQFLPIDSGRLKDCIKAQGMTLAEAGIGLGYSDGYISGVCYKGLISLAGAKLIKMEYGIEYDSYKPIDLIKQELEKAEAAKALQAEKLQFYQDSQENIAHAIDTLHTMLDMYAKCLPIMKQAEADMEALKPLYGVYKRTLERIKGESA